MGSYHTESRAAGEVEEEPQDTCSRTRSFFGGAGSVTARWLRNLCISTRLGSWSTRTSVRNARSCSHGGEEQSEWRDVKTREPELGKQHGRSSDLWGTGRATRGGPTRCTRKHKVCCCWQGDRPRCSPTTGC